MRSKTSTTTCLTSDTEENAPNLSRTMDRLSELPTLTALQKGETTAENLTNKEDNDNSIGKDANVGLGSMENNESSRDSGFAEKNSNTNGKVHAIDPRDNLNDNRQHVVDGGSLAKKIKQISMEETPLQVSGLSLSGSGVQLFVKIDEHNSGKTLLQKPKPARSRKAATKFTRTKDNNFSGSLSGRQTRTATDFLHGFAKNTHPEEGQASQTGDTSHRRWKEFGNKDDQADTPAKFRYEMKIAEQPPRQKYQSANKQSQQGEHVVANQEDKESTHRQVSYFPFGCNQNFQSTTSEFKRNVIKGPTWNVENGRIDVIKPLDSIPSTSRQRTTPPDNYDDIPLDYSRDSFTQGFQHKNIQLKRRQNSATGRRRHGSTSPYRSRHQDRYPRQKETTPECHIDMSSDDNDDADSDDYCQDNDDYCENNGNNVDKTGGRKTRDTMKRKKIRTTNVATKRIKESRSDEDVAAEISQRRTKRHDSELSQGDQSEQSLVGPQFNTNVLTSGSLDADTLNKFTEYTQALRKDLKQKYRDLSKLLRSFEDAVQERNNNQADINEETGTQDKRCRVM